MTIQHLIKTNFFMIDLHSSLESEIVRLLAALIALALFIFWYHKKALINFQAWALLMFIINMLLFLNFSPMPLNIPINEAKLNIQPFLITLMFLTSAITIWKLWRLTEKCLPKYLDYHQKKRISIKTSLLAHCFAFWHVIKNGKNDKKSCQKVKKNVVRFIKTR